MVAHHVLYSLFHNEVRKQNEPPEPKQKLSLAITNTVESAIYPILLPHICPE